MQQPHSPSSNNTFPFLKLPPELRNAIYEAALIAPCPIQATYFVAYSTTSLISGAFLRTCKQVYAEANTMFYTRNIFRVGDESYHATHASVWLSNIGSENAALIRKVIVEFKEICSRSDVLPFIDFLAELREGNRCRALREISVWIKEGENEKGRVMSISRSAENEVLLASALDRFQNLSRLVIGGGLSIWEGRLNNTGNVSIEIVSRGSVEWNERQAQRALWKEQSHRRHLKCRIKDWKADKEWKFWWDFRHGVKWCSRFRVYCSPDLKPCYHPCPCYICVALRVPGSSSETEQPNRPLDARVQGNEKTWKVECQCNDCNWMRYNGRRE